MQVRRRSSLPHRLPGWAAATAAFVVALPLLLAPALGVGPIEPAPASAAGSTSAQSSVTASFAPENSGLSRPGEALVISGTLSNGSSFPTAPGTVTFSVTRAVADETTLRTGFTNPDGIDTVPIGSIDAPSLSVAGSTQLTLVVTPEVLDAALAGTGWGPHLVVAKYHAGDVVTSQASALVRLDGAAPATVTAAVVLPLTVAPSTEGLIGPEELQLLTSPSGALTQRLDAAADPRVVLAVDPRIIASIHVLGSRAPEDAVQWLERLASSPNDKFPLQYADADPSLELAAGSGQLLAPTSFAAALTPTDFTTPPTTSPTPSGSPGPSPDPGPTGTPSPSPSASSSHAPTVAVPTTEEVLDFPWTRTDIAWSAAGSATDATVAAIATTHASPIVDEKQLQEPSGASATVGGTRVLVADSLSDAVSDAVYSVGVTNGRVAGSRAAALTAAAAFRDDGQRSVLLALDRGRASGTSIPARLTDLLTLPWLAPTSIDAATSGEAKAATLTAPTDDRAAQAAGLLQDETAIGAFSSVLQQPELLTGTARLDLLASMSAGWSEDLTAWSSALSTQRADSAAILKSVSIDDSSPINFFSSSSSIPVRVSNALPYPITVTVVPRASNGRLTIDPNSGTIDRESAGVVGLNANALSNGRVTVSLQLVSPTGVLIGGPRDFQLQLAPFVETVAIAVFAVVVFALLGFGTFRSIRRGRRARAAEAESTSDAESAPDA